MYNNVFFRIFLYFIFFVLLFYFFLGGGRSMIILPRAQKGLAPALELAKGSKQVSYQFYQYSK